MVNRGGIGDSMVNRGSVRNSSVVDWGSIGDSMMNWGDMAVAKVGVPKGISIGFSLTLSNMDSSCGVGNISSSTGISTSNSWDSSWGGSVDSNGVGNIGNSISNWMVDYWGSI